MTPANDTKFVKQTDRTLVITRVAEAPRHLVFEAWTNLDHVRRWLLGPDGWTLPVCESDLRPGGRHRSVRRSADGVEMEIRGVHVEVAAPERLVSTESWGADWPETLNTLVLDEDGGRTQMTLTILYSSPSARDAALLAGLRPAMSRSFERLDELLREVQGVDELACPAAA